MKRNIQSKIVGFNQLTNLVEIEKKKGRKIVLVGGAFDLLHWGHVKAIQNWSKLGDVLIVHLDSDQSVRKKKGNKRPIIQELKRAYQVAALEAVDWVCISNRVSFHPHIISKIKPDFFVRVRRGEFTEAQNKSRVKKFNEAYMGCKMVYVNPIKGVSTTRIINYIKTL